MTALAPTSTREILLPNQRHAVIDIGTNSVKLLVADIGLTVLPLSQKRRQTRLGQGSFRTKRLQPEALARTVKAIAELAAEAKRWRPTTIQVLATSAMREAANGDSLIEAVQLNLGLKVEIVSGDQEADYVFRGVTSDSEFACHPMLIVDVGGGSTEWIVSQGGRTHLRLTTPIGTTRLLEMNPLGDPPSRADLAVCRNAVAKIIHREVRPRLLPVLNLFWGRGVRLVGLGRTLKILAKLSSAPAIPDRRGRLRISWDQIHAQVERLWAMSACERRGLDGLDPGKVDIILTGALIYEAVVAEFDFSELFVSQRGLRYGALIARAQAVRQNELNAFDGR